jgi:hypothetical protein
MRFKSFKNSAVTGRSGAIMIHASNKPGVNGCQVYQLQLWSKNKAKIAIAPN